MRTRCSPWPACQAHNGTRLNQNGRRTPGDFDLRRMVRLFGNHVGPPAEGPANKDDQANDADDPTGDEASQ